MRKIIIRNIFDFLFVRNNFRFCKGIWGFWNQRIRLQMLLWEKKRYIQPELVKEILSRAENKTQSLLLESLVAVYGKMYKEMYLLCNPELDLVSITSDDEILEKLWHLQGLCQIDKLRDGSATCLFHQVSFREAIIGLREFIQEKNVTFLDLKAGAETICEICEIMGISEDVYDVLSDAVAEEFVRANGGKISGRLNEEELRLLWKRIYEQEET